MRDSGSHNLNNTDFFVTPLDVDTNIPFLKRRGFPRFITNHISIKVELILSKTVEDNNKYVQGKVINLSKQGMLIYLDKLVSISQWVDFKLILPKPYGIAEGKGKIMWGMEKSNHFHYGINFYHSDEQEGMTTLEHYIEKDGTLKEVSDRRKRNRRQKKESTEKDKRRSDRRTNKSLFLKCIRYNRMEKLMQKNHYFYLRETQSGSEAFIVRNGKRLLNLSSNNYLGFTTHDEVKEATVEALEKYGVGTGGSRILSGTMDLHNQLEKKLAEFKKGQDCMLYSSGYHTNVGVISALSNKDHHLIIDNTSHASIVDGCWLSKASLTVFKHNNMRDLKNILESININQPKLIITDGVFSMDGDMAKLDQIYDLAQDYRAGLMIDDAHGIGVMGKTGHGTAEHFDLEGKIELTVGTLSKALGSIGGFIVANKKVIHYLKHNSRSFIFSTSLPPAVCATALKSLEIIERDTTVLDKLWANINYMRHELVKAGFDIGKTESAIIPIIIGDEILTYQLAGDLEKDGVFVNPVAYPAVRKRASRLRLSIMATHNLNDLEDFIKKLKGISKKLKVI